MKNLDETFEPLRSGVFELKHLGLHSSVSTAGSAEGSETAAQRPKDPSALALASALAGGQ